MDANKLKVLREMGYTIPVTCGLCAFSKIERGDWGTCHKHTYKHLKHSGPPRQLSINRHGTCPDAKPSVVWTAELGKFIEFLDGEFEQEQK